MPSSSLTQLTLTPTLSFATVPPHRRYRWADAPGANTTGGASLSNAGGGTGRLASNTAGEGFRGADVPGVNITGGASLSGTGFEDNAVGGSALAGDNTGGGASPPPELAGRSLAGLLLKLPPGEAADLQVIKTHESIL